MGDHLRHIYSLLNAYHYFSEAFVTFQKASCWFITYNFASGLVFSLICCINNSENLFFFLKSCEYAVSLNFSSAKLECYVWLTGFFFFWFLLNIFEAVLFLVSSSWLIVLLLGYKHRNSGFLKNATMQNFYEVKTCLVICSWRAQQCKIWLFNKLTCLALKLLNLSAIVTICILVYHLILLLGNLW